MARADPHRQAVGIVRLRAAGPRRRQLAAQDRERITRAAAGGIRLVVDELRTDVTKTHKDARGRLRHNDVEHRDPQAAIAWLWRFLDRAKSAGELYGRALVIIGAEQNASRLAVPSSQRMPAARRSSHKDIAANAFRKLAGPHVPATLSKLERAVKRAHATDDKAEATARERQRAHSQPVEPETDDGISNDAQDEDLVEAA